ncbi:VOC family protein [Aquabacterium sp. A7-Y]|uniref:ArsI/CadI family heavy metal resistance metalloenzyme n=1 Tax=Aquabacterium sp. A7-Y TaxID=1349605 RepID=UPI00223E0611|nr:ArsI/CadI family heavy metal resistance metalloenzyme [Aquabacterium sp. A7-Y]MCW7541006.1 VOC family protein [Aquabacterium sp. A7-Y]
MNQQHAFVDESAAKFDTAARMHVNLVVSNIQSSLGFYKVLFGAEPTKVAKGYAKFELSDPPLNFSMNDCNCAPGGQGNLGHFGLQVKSDAVIDEAEARYREAGWDVIREKASECCHAVQSKVWLADPDANLWEVFVVHQDDHGEGCTTDCACYAQPKASLVTPDFPYAKYGLTAPTIEATRTTALTSSEAMSISGAPAPSSGCCTPSPSPAGPGSSCCATGSSCCN